jgi:hypothetical protein
MQGFSYNVSMKPAETIITVCALSVLWVILSTFSRFLIYFTIFLFDAPGSDKNIVSLFLAYSVWYFPEICAVSILLSVLSMSLQKFTLACCFILAPLVAIAPWAVIFVLGAVFG